MVHDLGFEVYGLHFMACGFILLWRFGCSSWVMVYVVWLIVHILRITTDDIAFEVRTMRFIA